MSLEDSNVYTNDSINFIINDFIKLLELLPSLSYESKLNKNLKNTLRKFDKELLILELNNCLKFYYSTSSNLLQYKFRIKSLQSILLKYDKYYPSTEVKACFNDILGFRVLVDSLDEVFDYLNQLDNIRIVDLRNGKKNDDGYRAIHLYYQKSNYHYPIEVQIWNKKDYEFHNWMHKYSYKYLNNSEGVRLRKLFDRGLINTEQDFINMLNLL